MPESEGKVLTVRCPGMILDTVFNQSFFSSLPEYQMSTVSSCIKQNPQAKEMIESATKHS
jgi:hypothetical protein